MILGRGDTQFESLARDNGLWLRTGGWHEDYYYEDFERVLPDRARFERVLGAALERDIAVVLTGATLAEWERRRG